MSLNRDLGEIQCEDCGRLISGKRPPKTKSKPKLKRLRSQAPTDDTPPQTWSLGGRIYSGEMNPWLRTMWESLRAQLHQGQREQALATCRRLLEYERDFVDAHIWIARLTQNPDERRAHLEKGLALQPQNADLMRMMMVLKGDLTEEEAARAADLHHEADVQTVDGAADAQTEVLLCPICRGGLTTTDGQVACKFCGYTDDTTENAIQPTPETSLVVALIKQRGQATRWQVGERMVHCNECGAERVLPAQQAHAPLPVLPLQTRHFARHTRRLPAAGRHRALQRPQKTGRKTAPRAAQQPHGALQGLVYQ